MMMALSWVTKDELAHAATLLGAGLSRVSDLARRLARWVTVDGRVSADRMDQKQLVSFELAQSVAELQAAQALLAYAQDVGKGRAQGVAELEAGLAVLFAAEALQSATTRVLARPEEYGLSEEETGAWAHDRELHAFVRQSLAVERLESLGKRVAQEQGQVGEDVLGEDHALMRSTFRKVAEQVVKPLAESVHREDRIIPPEILQSLTDLGAFGLSIPERYGGLQPDDGEDSLGMIVVTEELSRGSLGAAGSLITRPEIVSRSLLAGGTEEQKEAWLPRLAAGDPLCAVAVTEPDFGSDVASMNMPAVRTEGGWLLSGTKTWCTFAGKAGVLLVLARTNPEAKGHKRLSLFLVEKPSFDGHEFEYVQPQGGRMTGRAISTIGYRGMHSFEVNFENVFVPDANLIGGEAGLGKGFYAMMAGFGGGRIQTAARAVGVMQAAFEKGVSYALERKVFGMAVADYQLTRVKLARMAASLAASRQFTYAVARLMDQGQGQMEASLVKFFTCKAAEGVAREAMQIHGGMGYAEEYDVSRYYVDARVLSIFEGAEETLALKVIARGLVDRALEEREGTR